MGTGTSGTLASISNLLPKRFLIDYVRHPGDITAVIPLEYIDQPLHRPSRHAFLGIGRQPGDPPRARHMRIKPAAVLNRRIAQRRVFRQRLFFVNIKRAPAIQFSRSAFASAASSTTGPREVFTRNAVGFIAAAIVR